ncbi:MAG: 30S ribosomal protein S8 [Candidatus Beckwithbacteria bacterium]|nr:30S ribosomal protein S8 [Patescibacteria group bacterium]
MLSDPIADLLTRIRNAKLVNHKKVSIPHSILKENIVKILKIKGYIKDYMTEGKVPQKILKINLKYRHKISAINQIIRISKPGVRIYANFSELSKLMRGRGTVILSTSKGVMTAQDAKKNNLGGEVLLKVS